jgi:16S rRNA (uracil1498-N3)-methyltransferase
MSATPRLFVDGDLGEGCPVAMSGDQDHYLVKVMRLRAGDTVRVFNGRDGEFLATLHQDGKRNATLLAGPRTRVQAVSPDMRLLFAPLKKTRTDFLVEKAVEMGVSELWPVFTDRSDAERVRSDRLQRIALEAAEQCERLDVPVVSEAQPLAQAIIRWEPLRTLYFCDEAGDEGEAPWGGQSGRAPQLDAELAGTPRASAALLVGPEGGFSPAERNWLRSLPYVRPVSLGPRILRAETAVVAALALWQALAGDWSRR